MRSTRPIDPPHEPHGLASVTKGLPFQLHYLATLEDVARGGAFYEHIPWAIIALEWQKMNKLTPSLKYFPLPAVGATIRTVIFLVLVGIFLFLELGTPLLSFGTVRNAWITWTQDLCTYCAAASAHWTRHAALGHAESASRRGFLGAPKRPRPQASTIASWQTRRTSLDSTGYFGAAARAAADIAAAIRCGRLATAA